MLPNFLIIGAPKAGTTSLFYYLDAHPDIYLCPIKEVGFFWAYGADVKLHGPGKERLKHRLVADLDTYQRLFSNVKAEKAVGEASVRYLNHPRSPELIRQFIPDARLIVSLRQPAERAFSAFVHNLQDGVEPCSDFAEALAQERQGVRDGWTQARYLHNGFYARSLKRYLALFDRDQIHISLFEDLKNDTPGLVRSLFAFLGVEPDFTPDTSQIHNASGLIRSPVLRVAYARLSKLRAVIRPWINPRLKHGLSEWLFKDAEKLSLSPDLRAELTEFYRPEIEELQDLIRRDLSHWLKPAIRLEKTK
jgi:hypothetical protein